MQTASDLRAGAAGELARRLSPKYLEEHSLVPLSMTEGGEVLVAVGAPLDPTVLDELAWTYGAPVRVIEAPVAEIHAAVMSAAQAEDEGARDAGGDDLLVLAEEESTIDDLRALANQTPVIKLVNLLILEALRARASDIHLEATGEGLRVRYRIDGVLHDVQHPPRQYQAAVVSRVKIMAALNIAERRLAQDGRIRLRMSDRDLDLRVSITPTLHGESVVLRILDRGGSGTPRELGTLGMPAGVLREFETLVRQPHGIILVTGPTGSGKTTTLYGALSRLNQAGVKIVTVEDPVEYQMGGVTQIPVNAKIGLTFGAALRSILRHDPDIIMVGEMRDREAAEIAIQAALTGHLVFSTLHTNDAPGGVTRMVDMGIESYLVAATVLGILAQRLVRMVCEACAEEIAPDEEVLATVAAGQANVSNPHFRRGKGCEVCSGTGYRGRTGLYELMPMTPDLREAVVQGKSLAQLRALAEQRGMTSLRTSGWIKACEGVTTLDEVLRSTRDEIVG
jgi:general secretion pathway protein E